MTDLLNLEPPELSAQFLGARQQTTSGLARTNQQCYEQSGGCYAKYAFEYQTGYVSHCRNPAQ
jgi:hypothetical protein